MAKILCEGPRCNNGISAKEREGAIISELPTHSSELRMEAEKHARMTTSKRLKLTEHTLLEARGSFYIWCCDECGHERIYGNREHQSFGRFMDAIDA